MLKSVVVGYTLYLVASLIERGEAGNIVKQTEPGS